MSSSNLSSVRALPRRKHRSSEDLSPPMKVQCFSRTSAHTGQNHWSGTDVFDGAIEQVADPLVQNHAPTRRPTSRCTGVEVRRLQRGVCRTRENEGTGVRVRAEPRLHVLQAGCELRLGELLVAGAAVDAETKIRRGRVVVGRFYLPEIRPWMRLDLVLVEIEEPSGDIRALPAAVREERAVKAPGLPPQVLEATREVGIGHRRP